MLLMCHAAKVPVVIINTFAKALMFILYEVKDKPFGA